MADDQTAALIEEARKMIAGTTFWNAANGDVHPQREAMIARLADALERAQSIIDGVRELHGVKFAAKATTIGAKVTDPKGSPRCPLTTRRRSPGGRLAVGFTKAFPLQRNTEGQE